MPRPLRQALRRASHCLHAPRSLSAGVFAAALALAGALSVASLAPAPADAQGRAFYGVAAQGALGGGDYARMRRGRVGTLRFLISWRNVEPSPGSRNWGGTDQVIGQAASRRVRALPFIHGLTPEGVRNPPTRPADRRAFRSFMRALAGRYGPGGTYWQGPYQRQFPNGSRLPVRAWQLFNEQNGRFFWGERPRPRAYARLVRMGARGVRSQNPKAEIVLGGMFGTPSGQGSLNAWRFLNRFYRTPRIKRFFNTVAVHPYSPHMRGIRYQMRRVRNVMRRHNDRTAQIRVTEIGWGSARGSHSLLKGPKGQARLLRRSFRLLARHRNRRGGWNVKGVNWFSWQDGNAGCAFCPSAGLFSGPIGDRSPKRSWRAFRRIAR